MIRDAFLMINPVTGGFRLLNSEIGNDLIEVFRYGRFSFSFRLLNSEIGNDPSNIKMASEWGLRP